MFWLCLDTAGTVQCSHVALSACTVLSWHAIIAVAFFHFALLLFHCLLARSLVFLKLLLLIDATDSAVPDDDDAES